MEPYDELENEAFAWTFAPGKLCHEAFNEIKCRKLMLGFLREDALRSY